MTLKYPQTSLNEEFHKVSPSHQRNEGCMFECSLHTTSFLMGSGPIQQITGGRGISVGSLCKEDYLTKPVENFVLASVLVWWIVTSCRRDKTKFNHLRTLCPETSTDHVIEIGKRWVKLCNTTISCSLRMLWTWKHSIWRLCPRTRRRHSSSRGGRPWVLLVNCRRTLWSSTWWASRRCPNVRIKAIAASFWWSRWVIGPRRWMRGRKCRGYWTIRHFICRGSSRQISLKLRCENPLKIHEKVHPKSIWNLLFSYQNLMIFHTESFITKLFYR